MIVDIGEVLAVVGIAQEDGDHGVVDTIAIGSRGTVKFGMLAAVSRGEIRTEHGLLWSIQIRQFLDDCSKRLVERLGVGEMIRFLPQSEALKEVCAKGKDDRTFQNVCCTLLGTEKFQWVDMNQKPTDEPDWFCEARNLLKKCLPVS